MDEDSPSCSKSLESPNKLKSPCQCSISASSRTTCITVSSSSKSVDAHVSNSNNPHDNNRCSDAKISNRYQNNVLYSSTIPQVPREVFRNGLPHENNGDVSSYCEETIPFPSAISELVTSQKQEQVNYAALTPHTETDLDDTSFSTQTHDCEQPISLSMSNLSIVDTFDGSFRSIPESSQTPLLAVQSTADVSNSEDLLSSHRQLRQDTSCTRNSVDASQSAPSSSKSNQCSPQKPESSSRGAKSFPSSASGASLGKVSSIDCSSAEAIHLSANKTQFLNEGAGEPKTLFKPTWWKPKKRKSEFARNKRHHSLKEEEMLEAERMLSGRQKVAIVRSSSGRSSLSDTSHNRKPYLPSFSFDMDKLIPRSLKSQKKGMHKSVGKKEDLFSGESSVQIGERLTSGDTPSARAQPEESAQCELKNSSRDCGNAGK